MKILGKFPEDITWDSISKIVNRIKLNGTYLKKIAFIHLLEEQNQ